MRRPLSPHLQIYRVQISSGISALHRITGVMLSVVSGKVMLAIIFMTMFPDGLEYLRPYLTPITLRISLSALGSLWLFHTLASLRHLYWDTTRGLGRDQVIRSGQFLLVTWFVGTVGWFGFLWGGGVL